MRGFGRCILIQWNPQNKGEKGGREHAWTAGWDGRLGWARKFRQSTSSGFVGKARGATEGFRAGKKNNQHGVLGR